MPYNPGSAYPKKTTYIPHAHPNGLGINNPVNMPGLPMAPVSGGVQAARSALGLMDARAAAASQIYHGATASAQVALARRGVVGDVAAKVHETQGLKQNRVPKGNPTAMAEKQKAEASMDAASDAVLQSPKVGASTPQLIIPKWETRKPRTREGVSSWQNP
jgi:hypothetical protein